MSKGLNVLLLVALLSQPALAGGLTFGIGVSGGYDYPIGQDDQKRGTIFGFRGRLKAIPTVTLEPNIYFTKYGDPEHDEILLDIEGSKITAYGVDATLGAFFGGVGVKPYGLFGVGFYNVKRDQTLQDETNFGLSAGFGVELGFNSAIAIDVRGKLVIVPTDGGGSKKSASVTGGLNYYFGN